MHLSFTLLLGLTPVQSLRLFEIAKVFPSPATGSSCGMSGLLVFFMEFGSCLSDAFFFFFFFFLVEHLGDLIFGVDFVLFTLFVCPDLLPLVLVHG